MKKTQLIEIGILAVTLICGYSFITTLASTIIAVLYQFTSEYNTDSYLLIQYFIVTLIYLGVFIILVKKKTSIATYINQQTQPSLIDDEANSIKLTLYQHNLLYIILVAMCLVTFLKEIPEVLIGAFEYFEKESGGLRDRSSYLGKDIDFRSAIIKLVITFIVLVFAKPISEWFGKQADADKKIIETTDEV